MTKMTLDRAMTIVKTALDTGHEMKLNPLTVAVLDDGGHLIAFAKEGGGPLRYNVAFGKAHGAVGMGRSSRALGKMGEERPMFMQALIDASGGKLVPVPGGVLAKDADGTVVGGVGVSGDTSDNDAACAIAGIEAAGLVAED
ncbi:MAG: heme-binding protein [Bauldia litoralis]